MDQGILGDIKNKILVLEANRLDQRLDIHEKNKERIRSILTVIETLSDLITEESDNPNFTKVIETCENIKNDLIRIHNAYQGTRRAVEWLRGQNHIELINKISSRQELLIKFLNEWYKIVNKRIKKVGKGNKHLRDIPQHKNEDLFYVKVIELNPEKTIGLHPFTTQQIEGQRSRTNRDILLFDKNDPIEGYRAFSKEDDIRYPGSIIYIINGHHRMNELFRRYLQGRIDGNSLVEVKKKYKT